VVAEPIARAKRSAPSPASITWSVSSITLRGHEDRVLHPLQRGHGAGARLVLSITHASISTKPSKLSTLPVPAL
jgi:hypothetical protein